MSPPPPTPRRPVPTSRDLLELEPVPTLLTRLRAELSATFIPGQPMRLARAPGVLDVMGGILDYTGGLVCGATIDRAAAIAMQDRDDRVIQVFSFNLMDEHKPFTLIVPLDVLATMPIATLRDALGEPGRQWAADIVGCFAILHDEGLIDLKDPSIVGYNFATLSTVPEGAGVASSAAMQTAAMSAIVDHLGLRERVSPILLAAMCRRVQTEVVGDACAVIDHVTSCDGAAGSLTRVLCQPGELKEPLRLPEGIRVVGISTGVAAGGFGDAYTRTRCAAAMGRRIILDKMKQIGAAAGRELIKDPTGGYLANLALDDYKRFFRPFIPEFQKGGQFLLQYGSGIDKELKIEPDFNYPIQHATDHHVFDANRVRNFVQFVQNARDLAAGSDERKKELDKAGHLMYASHASYTDDAMLGSPGCDLLMTLARQREHEGIYGARITGTGLGGTVAILCNTSDRADRAIADILQVYQQQTGKTPEGFGDASPGAIVAGTRTVIA